MDANSVAFRYAMLGLNCLLTFGSYFCFDMPTVLETKIEEQVIARFTTEVSTYYNLFYTVYAWTNMCMSLVAGVLVDKIGTRSSAFLFLSLCLAGSSLFALGASMTTLGGETCYIMMFIGRFIFGLGGGSITIVQNAITAKWFNGRELAFAFGCTLTISRIGSVINYDTTSLMYQSADFWHPGLGLGITLWFGAALVALSYLAAGGIMLLEHWTPAADVCGTFLVGNKHDESRAPPDKNAKQSLVHEMTQLPAVFWMVCLIITLFYNLIFPWQAVAVDYIKTFYGPGHDNEWASWRASMVYMVSMVLSPFLGAAVDYFGRRDWLAIFGTGLSIPVFLLLGSVNVDPILPLLMLGICYSVCAATLWPTLQLLVDQKMVGRANGIATSMQMLGIGICNIIVGVLKDSNKKMGEYSPECCGADTSASLCYESYGSNNCAYGRYGSCSGVFITDSSGNNVEVTESCVGTNYSPMLIFFLAMASIALICACLLKFMDRHRHMMHIGIRDQKRAFEQHYGYAPKTPKDMTEGKRMVHAALRSGTSLYKPVLDADFLE